MAKEEKLIGPADAEAEKRKSQDLEDAVKVIDVDGSFSLGDFQPLQMESVRTVHPFEGYPYPMGKINVVSKDHEGKIIGERLVQATYVVAYIHPVPQDPSGKGYVVTEDYKMDEVLKFGPYEGKTIEQILKLDKEYATNLIKTGKQRHAPLKTSHNRAIRDWQEMRNYDVVFEQVAVLKDGEMPNCAVVANHNLRAQLVYRLDERTGAVKVDPRYALLDRKQRSRLLQTFRMLVAPQLKNIRLQQLVTGEMEVPDGASLADALGEKE